MHSLTGILVASAFSLASVATHAALITDTSGRLLGATEVMVSGTAYDVQFLDGTCIALFAGCDDVSDFAFHTLTDAAQAGQALVDQVFLNGPLGAFDDQPWMTSGCTYTGGCAVFTPFSLIYSVSATPPPPYPVVGAVQAWNSREEIYDAYDTNSHSTLWRDTNERDWDSGVYAVWTRSINVPEPGTLSLLAIALIGLTMRKRFLVPRQ
jgi:hypothetical protein